jgi:GMP synthase-like glutamine amidotransferase
VTLIAAIRHVPFEGLGYVVEAIERAGFKYRYFDLYAGDAPPQVDDFEALISMGGPMSANDNLPYLEAELRLLERAAAWGKPLLGICLGSQMIAKALGGRVYRNPIKEIGWAPVHWTANARSDALLGGLVEPETVFHWHGETFDPPSGSIWLAWSDACRNQAFRLDTLIYGFQFHLEVTPEMIADWCEQDVNCGDLREVTTPIDPNAHAARQRDLAGHVFGRWAELVRRGDRPAANDAPS